MIDRRLFMQFDWLTFLITLSLSLIGLASIYSATHAHLPSVYHKEFYWILIGLAVLVASVILSYTLLERFAHVIWGGSVVLLLSLRFIGASTGGAKRWIDLGPFSVQPSELAKLAIIVVLSRHFSSRTPPHGGHGLRELALPALYLLVPFVLIAKQPDLGTAAMLLAIFCSMVLMVRVRTRTLVGVGLAAAAIVPLGWGMLKGYQKARLTSFLSPGSDPLGSGYHVLQSKIAIGSGGLTGKGFTLGTQGKLMFLPEHHTDFIFSSLAEEWGLMGSLVVLALFLTLIMSGLNIASNAKDRFGFLLAFGITSMFFWHVVINLGMVSGMLPVVGVPLPFISYGGSFLMTSMIGVGLLINVKMRRFIF